MSVIVDSFSQVLNESSSRGNQAKFYKDGLWVKIDSQFNYEGLAEEFVSLFENCILNFPYVAYRTVDIMYNDERYIGCMSEDMWGNDAISFVSLRNLLRQSGVRQSLVTENDNIAINIANTVQKVMEITGLDILDYLGRLLMLDCLILNEDRHLMNLGVAFNKDARQYSQVPCFDNGASLFCVNWTYRGKKSFEDNMRSAMSVARPFSKFYEKQLSALLGLGCQPLLIVKSRLDELLSEYNNPYYSDARNTLIKEVLVNRLKHFEGSVFIYV